MIVIIFVKIKYLADLCEECSLALSSEEALSIEGVVRFHVAKLIKTCEK